MRKILDEHCKTKHQVQGSDPEIVVLNRTIRWEDDKIVYAANRGHAAQIVKAMRTSTVEMEGILGGMDISDR